MSSKLRGSTVKWDSSTEENDTYESKYKTRLHESSRSRMHQTAPTENEMVAEPRRRGRGPSKRPCLNRNALMARENRLKKKAYLEKIENKLAFYQQENKNLINVIRKQGIDIKRLTSEVSYLKRVLNNNTSITALLKSINNGLRRISTQKKNSLIQNHVSECSSKLDVQHKNMCCENLKENALNTEYSNIFGGTIDSDPLTENATSQNHRSKSYVNERRSFACKDSTLDSDHTYIVSKTSTVDIKDSHQSKEALNVITSTTSSISEDSYMDNAKEFDNLLPITQEDLHNVEEKKDIDTVGIDFDQLSTFNMDIFEDLSKCDEMMSTVESLNDETNLFTEEGVSESLDNTGICLHVNSDKVCLEFCSICHLNSKNSGLN